MSKKTTGELTFFFTEDGFSLDVIKCAGQIRLPGHC